MILSWAPKTQSSYNTYIKRWVAYFKSNKILETCTATYQEAVSFFAHLFNKEDQKYGAMAVARSALSAILPKIGGKTFGQEPNVSQMRHFQGETITSQAKYVTAYDPDIILRYIDSLPHDTFLLLELLIKKLCTLLCLLSGGVQSLQAIKLSRSNLSNGTCTFYINKILKTTTPGKHHKPFEYREFSNNKKFCMVSCLKEYISQNRINLGKPWGK